MVCRVICAVRTLLNIEALESRSILSLNDFLGKDKSSADRVGGLAAGVASQLTQEDCLSIFYIVYSYSLLCIDLLKSYQFVANGVESEPESGGSDSGDSDGSNSDSSSDDDLLFWQRGKTVPAPQQTPRKMRQANRKGGQAQQSRSGSELERDTECADKPINMKMCLELLDHLVLVSIF